MHQETMQVNPSTGPRFRPYATPNHHVTKGRYITSNDPRGYIPVYEFPLNGQWIMMDIDDGYILWTGIWKALGHSKADIVKMVDAQPDLAPLIRRVRGGYLKIQGTWMPYEVALRLARRVAWPIRDDLIPLFGPTFPSTCLSPDQPGFGQVIPNGQSRRRARRNTQASTVSLNEQPGTWNTVNDTRYAAGPAEIQTPSFPHYPPSRDVSESAHASSGVARQPIAPSPSRYTPYPPKATNAPRVSYPDNSPDVTSYPSDTIILPPIHPGRSDSRLSRSAPSSYALPPISALEDLRGMNVDNTAAVLQRLRSDGQERAIYPEPEYPTMAMRTRERRRSISTPPYPPRADFPPQGRKQSIHLTIPSSSSSSSASTSASPISPSTPQSSSSYQLAAKFDNLGLVPLHVLQHTKEQHDLHRRSIDFGYPDGHRPMRPW